jgi:uncharacterized peroxidase-related enzyme
MTQPFFTSLAQARGIREVLNERPTQYSSALVMAQEILREPSHLLSSDRELIAAYTSKLNNCLYCCGSHTAFAISIGASEDDVEKVVKNENYVGHRLEPILLYVKKLTLEPSSLGKSDVELVLSAGFTEEELKDAISVCAIFNFFNRIVEGHGIAENSDTYDISVAMVNKHGYDRRY